MASASERSYTRRDTVMFLVCLGLSLVGLFSPDSWGLSIAAGLRESVLAPLVWLQARAEEGKTSRVRLRAITTQRDSASYLAQGIPPSSPRTSASASSCCSAAGFPAPTSPPKCSIRPRPPTAGRCC